MMRMKNGGYSSADMNRRKRPAEGFSESAYREKKKSEKPGFDGSAKKLVNSFWGLGERPFL